MCACLTGQTADKGIPEFWETVLLKSDVTAELIKDKDLDVLSYLSDIQVCARASVEAAVASNRVFPIVGRSMFQPSRAQPARRTDAHTQLCEIRKGNPCDRMH